MTDTEQQINSVCNQIKTLLILKNKAYGDSALEPVRIFSKSSSIDGLLVRIDDKLSRIKNMGISSASEDTLMDLIGYLILLKIQLPLKILDILNILAMKKHAHLRRFKDHYF